MLSKIPNNLTSLVLTQEQKTEAYLENQSNLLLLDATQKKSHNLNLENQKVSRRKKEDVMLQTRLYPNPILNYVKLAVNLLNFGFMLIPNSSYGSHGLHALRSDNWMPAPFFFFISLKKKRGVYYFYGKRNHKNC